MYKIKYHKKAEKDKNKLKGAGLQDNLRSLIQVVRNNPYQNPPPYEKLIGNLNGMYSIRINIKHRLVYKVNDADKIVKVLSMWSHYE